MWSRIDDQRADVCTTQRVWSPTQLGIHAEELVQGLQLLTVAVEPRKALEAILKGFEIGNKV
jgi:hypothetical protein